MSTPVGYANAVATLARHGIDAESDVGQLEAAIAARGWRVELARVDSGYHGGRRRVRVLATRPHDPLRSLASVDSRSMTAASARHALVMVLAKVLAQEDRTSSA